MFKRKSKSDKPPKPPKAKKEKKEKQPRAKREKPAKKAAVGPTIAIKKQPTDIYTVMLIISMVCVLIACVLLYLELSSYGSYPWWNAS